MILPRSWHLFFRSPPISFCFLWLGPKGGKQKKTQPANWIQAVLCTKSRVYVCVLAAIMALARLSLFPRVCMVRCHRVMGLPAPLALDYKSNERCSIICLSRRQWWPGIIYQRARVPSSTRQGLALNGPNKAAPSYSVLFTFAAALSQRRANSPSLIARPNQVRAEWAIEWLRVATHAPFLSAALELFGVFN